MAGGGGAQRSPTDNGWGAAGDPNTDNASSVDVNPPDSQRSPPPLPVHDQQGRPGCGDALRLATSTEEEEEAGEVLDDREQQPRARGRFIKDPEGSLTHDETTVDVVTVPCPGGDALRSWSRDGLLGRYFGAPSMRDAEVDRPGSSAPSWVRQGVRREADVARILLYKHPAADEGTTLDQLASVLLEELQAVRDEDAAGHEQGQRPVVFVAHSVGGLVVKLALVRASREPRYGSILRDCFGVAFFGTPHQGSSYFAMPSLAGSIQNLLQLSGPLPTSITDDLRTGNRLLLGIDDEFKAIAHDLRVWTLYETIDSRLSGAGTSDDDDNDDYSNKDGLYFTAPLTSVKSAILGMRQERIFPLQSDHANVGSFGRHNAHTLRLFLRQLASLIGRADESVREAGGDDGAGTTTTTRWTLDLEQRVGVEVHGFFEDTAAGAGTDEPVVRAWSTKLPLSEFLRKGPDECLSERLHEVDGAPDESQFLRHRGRTTSLTEADDDDDNDRVRREEALARDGLGIRNQLLQSGSPPVSPVIRPVDASPRSAPEVVPSRQQSQQSQQIRRLSSPPLPTHAYRISTPPRYSPSFRRPSPLMRPDIDQDLMVDKLSPPARPRSVMSFGRSFSDQSSRVEYRDFPPFSQQRSRSNTDQDGARSPGNNQDDNDDGGIDSPPLPDPVLAIRKAAREVGNRTSGTVATDDAPAAFARPEASQRKFVWVHLPYNNPTWVKKIVETLQASYRRDYSALSSQDFWTSKHTRGRHSQHYAYFAKPGCYFTAPRRVTPQSHSMSPPRSLLAADDAISLCLFLPYLHFDSYKRLIRRRNLIMQRLARGRAHPVPEDVAKSGSMELQVIWEYLGHDPPVNCRRTLDQFGYPALKDTRGRDDDQMLYKLTKERECRYGEHHGGSFTHSLNSKVGSHGSHGSWGDGLVGLDKAQAQAQDDEGDKDEDDGVRNGNVLMVDQLWLWAIHSHTLLSFFPKRESDPIEGPLYQQADLRDSIFNDVNVDLTRQCDNALDLAALSALHAVSVLLDRASHPDLEVFRIFEEAISILTEKLTHSLKTFRVEGFKDKASSSEPVENKERSIRARHKEEGRRAEQENRDNTSALLELRDLEDELLVMLQLFERQHAVLSSMLAAYGSPALHSRTGHGQAFIAEAIRRVGEYRRRADDMGQRVRSTRDDYDKLLQMVQRQAQVDEVRLSRLHADLASAQGRSVMIFTVFTIIFLPLSFFTSLFGMNTREWDGQPPPLRFIGAISLPASLGLIAISLVAAFSTNTRRLILWARDGILDALRWLYDVLLSAAVDAAVQKWQGLRITRVRRRGGGRSGGSGGSGRVRNGEERREARRRVKKEASDFWERHRPERERGYQIPEANRNEVARKRSSGKGKDSRGR